MQEIAKRQELFEALEAEARRGHQFLPQEEKREKKSPNASSPRLLLRDIQNDLGDCLRCKLSNERTKLVFGVGNSDADLLFVGEAPGRDEDLKGEPFVGRAGKLLTDIIEAIGLKREEVYICNVVKCRPPQNRNPEPDEIEKCRPFLQAQIQKQALLLEST